MAYSPQSFEKKWRKYWEDNEIYKVVEDDSKEKYYCLDMFPYPSGKGLHVGHPLGYIASDIISRYKRMKGYNVLHPMGFDAFGLPAEQYAIQSGVHPADSTRINADRYRQQLKNLGLSYDWSREFKTSDPDYYKWTQWIFTQLFQHYFDTSEKCAKPITSLEKYFAEHGTLGNMAHGELKIEFSAEEWQGMSDKEKADILMDFRLVYRSTAFVNWCEELGTVLANDEVKDGVSERGGHPVTKKAMLQWSLRTSAYAERLLDGLDEIEWSEALKLMQKNWIGRSEGARISFGVKESEKSIEVFTTRPDTIYGVSFMVLAPELDLVQELTTLEHRTDVESYIKYVSSRSERERMSEMDDMSGCFTGSYAINPVNQKTVPIYISEYVLKDYGTGAIMAVPDGDDRDKRFAEKYGLPIPKIREEKEGVFVAVNSDSLNGLRKEEAISQALNLMDELSIGAREINFKLRDANFSRQRYWGEPIPIYFDEDNISQCLDVNELPLELPHTEDFLPSHEGKSPLSKIDTWVLSEKGRRETDTMPGFAGSSWYYYRYMDPKNDGAFVSKSKLDYWKEVDLYVGGAEHAVGHLLYARMFSHFLHDTGNVPVKEPFKRLLNQGMIQGRSNFVFRANENFAEHFLEKILAENISSFEKNILVSDTDGNTFSADFACLKSKVIIELKSVNNLHRYYDEHKADFERAGYIFLPLSVEELFFHYYEPQVIIDKIQETTSSLPIQDYCCNTGLFISKDMIEDPKQVTQLHVDISLVDNKDILDLERFEKSRVDLDKAIFILNKDGDYLCDHQVEKMSKSKLNVINPDEVVETYGTDCFRLYEMFLGPIEQAKPWDTQNIGGVSKFLRKFHGLFISDEDQLLLNEDEPTEDEYKILHTAIKKLEEDIDRVSLNTCVSAMMIATNGLLQLDCHKRKILDPLVRILAPFAPHLAEELWQNALGNNTTVVESTFPELVEKYLVKSVVEYPLCVNGKKRTTAVFSADTGKEDLEKGALDHEEMQKWLEGKTVVKVIVVPNRMINIVVR